MTPIQAEEFTQSLGQVVSGAWRIIKVAKELGVPKALGMETDQWVDKYLGGYVKMNVEDRREVVKELAQQGLSNVAIGELVGVDETQVRRDKKKCSANAEDQTTDGIYTADDAPDDSANAEHDSQPETPKVVTPATATRQANEAKRKAVMETPVDPEILPGVYCEDFFTGSNRIADESVDLVFTDPPYDRDSVDLYRKAAKVAARILKPGGSFIAYSGQKYLPEVYGLINHPALRYWWTFAGVHAGGNQMLEKLGIRCGWKPIVWYVKGTRGDVSEVLADVVTGAREKTYHEWQQSEAEAMHFIEKLTFPGALVVDFFLGGGTTKIAADKLGRRFIGFEIDASTGEKAKNRILKIQQDAA